jgi:hypothetical protein
METGTQTVAVALVPREMVTYHWAEVDRFIKPAVEASEGLMPYDQVKECILDGTFGMWLAVEESGPVGMFLSELLPVSQGIDLNVPYAGFDKTFKALNQAMKELIRQSEEQGIHAVRFISADERFGAFAKRHGFRRRFIEYVYDIKE